MKAIITLFFIGLLSLSANAQEFKFEQEIINYGKIAKGENGERTFVFTNVGDKPLIIDNIRSSCGCTVPKKPKSPIMPGEKGEIKVSYDTKRLGGFAKAITIFSNAKNSKKVIKIRGNVYDGVILEKKKSMVSDN